MKEINARIRMYRRIKNLTQTDVAEMMDMNTSTYSQMERKGLIPCENLIKLSEILRVNATTLLYGEGDYPDYEGKPKPKLEPEPEKPKPEPKPEPSRYVLYDMNKKERDHIMCLRNIGVKHRNYIMMLALKVLKKEINLPIK